ncbi:hypothetical protein ACI65C_002980 [Semiaphis heraclei]
MKCSVACKTCYGESCSNARIEIQPDDQCSDSDSDHEHVTTTKRKKGSQKGWEPFSYSIVTILVLRHHNLVICWRQLA